MEIRDLTEQDAGNSDHSARRLMPEPFDDRQDER